MTGRRATTDVRPGRLVLSVGHPERNAPPGWRWVALSDVATMATGHTPSRKHPEYWGGDIPWMNVGDARPFHGRVIHRTSETTNSLGIENSAAVVLPKGTVCLSRTGSIGYAVILGRPMATSQGFVNWICGPELLPEFLQQIFLAEHAFLQEISEGVAHTTIYFPEVKAFHVCIPRVEHQRRIVAEVDKQLSRLDEAVDSLKRGKASIARYQASLLSEAAGSNGRWTSCTLADLLRERIVNGLSVKESATPTLVRALRLSAMSESGLNYADHRFLPVDPASVDDILVEEGDFFVSRGNGSLALVGRGAIAQTPPFPIIFPDTMMRLRFVDDEITRWVAVLWPSRLVRRQIEQRVKTTAGIYKMAQPQVASISVPLPPVSERERIVAEVDRRLSIVREIEVGIDANLMRAHALRRTILGTKFAGERGA